MKKLEKRVCTHFAEPQKFSDARTFRKNGRPFSKKKNAEDLLRFSSFQPDRWKTGTIFRDFKILDL